MDGRSILNHLGDRLTRLDVLNRRWTNGPGEVVIACDANAGEVLLHRFGGHEREPEVDAFLGELVGQGAVEDCGWGLVGFGVQGR